MGNQDVSLVLLCCSFLSLWKKKPGKKSLLDSLCLPCPLSEWISVSVLSAAPRAALALNAYSQSLLLRPPAPHLLLGCWPQVLFNPRSLVMTLPTLLLKADLSFHPTGTPATNNIIAKALKCSVDEECALLNTQPPRGKWKKGLQGGVSP